jgi:hypothetical protein
MKCNGCHVKSGIGKVDLVSKDSDLFGRLKGVKATSGACADRPYIDAQLGPDGHARGNLFDRMTDASCGPTMPYGVPLTPAQIQCIRDWATAKIKRGD